MDLDWTRPSSCGHTHDMGCFDYYVQGSSLLMTEIERSTMTWRWAALSVYLLICFYDFLFVPVWYGLNRPNIEEFMVIINSKRNQSIWISYYRRNWIRLLHLLHMAMGYYKSGPSCTRKSYDTYCTY